MLEDHPCMICSRTYCICGDDSLLIVTTILLPSDTKLYAWLVMGPVSLQPAEFAKFATALALAKYMNSYSFSIKKKMPLSEFIILLPMLLIIGQQETGSALVYLALVLYREGNAGSILLQAYAP